MKTKELTDINQKHWITQGRFKYFLKYGYFDKSGPNPTLWWWFW